MCLKEPGKTFIEILKNDQEFANLRRSECYKHMTKYLHIMKMQLPLYLLHLFMEQQELSSNRNIFICIQSVDIICTFEKVEFGSTEFSICYHVFSFQ